MRRLAWLIAALALTAFSIYEVVVHDLGPIPIIVFAVMPDLAFLAGLGQPHRRGQLPTRAVPVYNAAHQLAVPLVVIGLALVALLTIRLSVDDAAQFEAARRFPLILYVAGVVWLVHIAFDRAFGFGLRTPDGWRRRGPESRD